MTPLSDTAPSTHLPTVDDTRPPLLSKHRYDTGQKEVYLANLGFGPVVIVHCQPVVEKKRTVTASHKIGTVKMGMVAVSSMLAVDESLAAL